MRVFERWVRNNRATLHKWPFEGKKKIRPWITIGMSLKMSAYAHWLNLPGKACQPESDSQVRTGYSILRSVFAILGIAFFGNAAAASQQQRHVPLWLGRKISRALCAWSVLIGVVLTLRGTTIDFVPDFLSGRIFLSGFGTLFCSKISAVTVDLFFLTQLP